MIKTEKEYKITLKLIEELLKEPSNIEKKDTLGYVQLNLLSDLVADYEEKNYPVPKPTLVEVIKIKMAERNLTQKALSELLEVSTSRVSEYMTGKTEPTLKVARKLSKELNIDPSIVLGV